MPIFVSLKKYDKLLGTKEGADFRYRYHNWAVVCLFVSAEIFIPDLAWFFILVLGFGAMWWEYKIEIWNITRYYKK